MSKFVKPKIDVIIDNYVTTTKTKHLDDAFKKVDQIKAMTGDIIED